MEACFPLFIGSSPFHMDESPSSAHHPLEAGSASELQRYFASGPNHSLRTPGNHVNCQISILGNSSENSTWVVLLSPPWQADSGWMIGRWRRTADTRGELTAGGNRDCENRRLSSALPFFPSCLPLWLLAGDNRQTTEYNGRPSYQKCPFSFFSYLSHMPLLRHFWQLMRRMRI